MKADERHYLLVSCNDTQSSYPHEQCIHQLFEAQVERTPQAIAAICEGEMLSYQQLDQQANQLAHYLRAQGVGPEVLVGICMQRSLPLLVALLAVLKAGGAYVPLDPAYPQERLAFMLHDAQVALLLTQRCLLADLPPFAGRVLCLGPDWPLLTQQPTTSPGSLVYAEHPAYVIYTSGSTGEPKGVLAPHRGALNRFHWMWQHFPFAPGEVCCQKTSLSFVDSVWEIFGPLLQGIPLVLVADEVLKDPQSLLRLLARERVSRIVLVPSLLRVLLNNGTDFPHELPALRTWVSSGEVLSAELVEQFAQRLPHGALINLYGSSEVAADVTCYEVTGSLPSGAVPIGRPIANTQVYLLDQQLQPVHIGVPGNLYVGGEGLARGYLNRPELTAERFIPHPFSQVPGARLYCTGDLARYRSDGSIEFLGRLDQQVKIRGYRIELGEIETVLKAHPAVQEAVVVARTELGSDPRLLAYFVQQPDYLGSASQVAEGQAEQLAQWEMVWDETYQKPSSTHDPTFNIAGWTSSYSGLPIPAEQMQEWTERTVERVLSLRPKRVLEIGCGTGLLLLRLAACCDEYVGTDFSPTALHALQQEVDRQGLSQVLLLERSADTFAGLVPHSFDAVVLNSVVQYFPSIDYLVRVLEGAVQLVRPGGFIFVGDVRSLPLLQAFHTSVELHRASSWASTLQLRQRAQRRMTQEKELVIDSAFFSALRQYLPMISQARILLKRGQHINEITKCRYDVILHVGQEVPTTDNLVRMDWLKQGLSVSTVHRLLVETRPEVLELVHVPNARLLADIRALDLLAMYDQYKTVGNLREAMKKFQSTGMNPEILWALGEELSYEVDIRWSEGSVNDCYDVVFRQCSLTREARSHIETIASSMHVPFDSELLSSYANKPLQENLVQKLMLKLRRYLQGRLPEYMVPSVLVPLEELPLTPNGKVNRRALSAPDYAHPELENAFVPPRIPQEKTLAEVWTQVLGLEQVVVNHEEQYSIWPVDQENAPGWWDTGKSGSKEECLAHIKEVWTDMRPLSLRKKMLENPS